MLEKKRCISSRLGQESYTTFTRHNFPHVVYLPEVKLVFTFGSYLLLELLVRASICRSHARVEDVKHGFWPVSHRLRQVVLSLPCSLIPRYCECAKCHGA